MTLKESKKVSFLKTNKTTVLNLTNHSYFNLSGDAKESILGHTLSMQSDYVLKLDEFNIATGDKISVKDTPAFDFNKEKLIGN